MPPLPKPNVSSPITASSSSRGGDRSVRLLHDLTSRAWTNYRILSKATDELKPTCAQILSIIGALHVIEDHREKGEISAENKKTLVEIGIWLNGLFGDLEAELDDLKQGNSQDGFSPIVEKDLDPNDQLNAFIALIRRDRQYKIWNALEEIHGNDAPETQTSVASDWTFLELQMHGLSKDILQEEFFFINMWFKDRKEDRENEPQAPPVPSPDEDLPDYVPGSAKAVVDVKVQDLEESTQFLSLEGSSEGPAAPKADPPPYTFDGAGGEDAIDDAEFTSYMQKAIGIEENIRTFRSQNKPEEKSDPLAWLSKEHRDAYRGRKDIITMMERDSFTVMAYETAPRCKEAVERLTSLFRTSIKHESTEPGWRVISEAMEALKVISAALEKFTLLENQTSGHTLLSSVERFSDMDQLEFETSTLETVNPGFEWPSREFALVQKSYYQLLTYIMGFLEALAINFPGRTYITRPRDSLERSWAGSMMPSRVAWIEKQLAGWSEVDEALFACRDWHRLRPNIQRDALEVLKRWAESEEVLTGNDKKDMIEFTVVAAANLPKSSFRIPKCIAKVVYYGPNRLGGSARVTEFKTEVSQKTNNPVWNKTFKVQLVPHSRFIDIEIHDRMAGADNMIARTRCNFSLIPGVEANFLQKSLLYDFDDDIELPMKEVAGKGKGTDPALLRLHVKWNGRYRRLEELGLPMVAPGKMFRKDYTDIPMSLEERTALALKSPVS
ncbi:hypothetical protein HYFRA_00004549 [Hymenoscyphus fraxineus]|uniref:C2 domain-containing protein n=1 Tax=Hymenoscyphus fraxineus TaxID=746836 RepID=A0A9N9KVI4_9HELO|nr:hypothetical protein HYFRA_00004549 [Hymenoscyphus fraxineus]